MSGGEKLRISRPIVVEGRYDKARLASFLEADIFTTDGFGIFRDREKLSFFRRLAQKDGIIVLTDSDRAGFQIRAHIAGAVPPDKIFHVYIPEILGKEPRKHAPSAAGTLGVEGVPIEILRRAFREAGVLEKGDSDNTRVPITKADLYRLGLSGGENSAEKRRMLLRQLSLPGGLGTNALPAVLSRLLSLEELEMLVSHLSGPSDEPRK